MTRTFLTPGMMYDLPRIGRQYFDDWDEALDEDLDFEHDRALELAAFDMQPLTPGLMKLAEARVGLLTLGLSREAEDRVLRAHAYDIMMSETSAIIWQVMHEEGIVEVRLPNGMWVESLYPSGSTIQTVINETMGMASVCLYRDGIQLGYEVLVPLTHGDVEMAHRRIILALRGVAA